MKKMVLLLGFYFVACSPLKQPSVQEIIERSIFLMVGIKMNTSSLLIFEITVMNLPESQVFIPIKEVPKKKGIS